LTRLAPRCWLKDIDQRTGRDSLLGILPGGGHVLASFAAYTVEKKLLRTSERFGRGAIEGVAGPESANNAAAQTSFIPCGPSVSPPIRSWL
jgi:putative tricarboxylic transport membrane protein